MDRGEGVLVIRVGRAAWEAKDENQFDTVSERRYSRELGSRIL